MGNLEVGNLDLANLHFAIKFADKYGLTTYNLKPAGMVKPVYEALDNIHYEREYEAFDKDNKEGVLVRKQIMNYGPKNKSKGDNPICIVLKKEIEKNGLGLEDGHYYYIIYRKGLLTSWGNSLGLKKYIRVPGIYLPFEVMKHIDNSKLKERAELVLVLGDGRIFTISAHDLFKYFFKIKMALLINAYGQSVTGIPLSMFNEFKESE